MKKPVKIENPENSYPLTALPTEIQTFLSLDNKRLFLQKQVSAIQKEITKLKPMILQSMKSDDVQNFRVLMNEHETTEFGPLCDIEIKKSYRTEPLSEVTLYKYLYEWFEETNPDTESIELRELTIALVDYICKKRKRSESEQIRRVLPKAKRAKTEDAHIKEEFKRRKNVPALSIEEFNKFPTVKKMSDQNEMME